MIRLATVKALLHDFQQEFSQQVSPYWTVPDRQREAINAKLVELLRELDKL